MYFDERKFLYVDVDFDTGAVAEPEDATEDELHLLRRWGMHIVPTYPRDPKLREAFFEATSYDWEPQVQVLLEPLSQDVRRFELFEEASSPYMDFVNTPALIGGVEDLRLWQTASVRCSMGRNTSTHGSILSRCCKMLSQRGKRQIAQAISNTSFEVSRREG